MAIDRNLKMNVGFILFGRNYFAVTMKNVKSGSRSTN